MQVKWNVIKIIILLFLTVKLNPFAAFEYKLSHVKIKKKYEQKN